MEATMTFSRSATPLFFKGVSREDLKWTINYLISLLEVPEPKKTVSKEEEFLESLWAMPDSYLSAEEEKKIVEENRKVQHLREFNYAE